MKLRSSLLSIIISLCLFLTPTLSIAGEKKIKIYRIPQENSKTSIIIYKHPNPHSKVIKKVSAKTRWIVGLSGVKKYSSSTWLHVSLNKKKGWIELKHLVFDSQATAIAAKKPECILNTTRNKSCDPG